MRDSFELAGPIGEARELKTLSRRDPEFIDYLDGSFSKTLRALPLRSLNVGTSSEQVTFEIKSTSQIIRPSSFRIARLLARPSTLAFSAVPMAVILASMVLRSPSQLNWLIAIGSFLGVIAFHIATNLFNDYGDHIKGQDRVRPHGGSRVIQRGWVRAVTVKRAAWALVLLAAILGLPAFLGMSVFIIALAALLVGLEFAFQKLKLKRRGWAECAAFLLTGPLLATGYAWSSLGKTDVFDFLCGCVFGSLALMYFHSVNFENIMPDSQAGARTWATRTGFDASKKFFYFTAGLSFIFLLALIYVSRESFLVPALLLQSLFLIPACLRVSRLASPLSSDLVGLRWQAIRLSWMTAFGLCAGFFGVAIYAH